MIATVIEGATIPIGAPKGWDPKRDGPCNALHVRLESKQGLPFMCSAWEADPDEIGWMLAGAKAHLGISAPQHPVVTLGVGRTPTKGLPVYTIRPTTELNGFPAVLVTMFAPRPGLVGKGGAVWCQIAVEDGDLPRATAHAMEQIHAKAKELGVL